MLCMGPTSALATACAPSMGPDAAVHVHDDALHGSCALNTAKVLQAAVRQVEPDIVLCGSESTDAHLPGAQRPGRVPGLARLDRSR